MLVPIKRLQCRYKTGGICKDYGVDNVKCKNLKYKTDESPKWDCDFKFKVSKVAVYRFDVLYESHTFKNNGEINYCYKEDSQFLRYTLDYSPMPNQN